MNEQNKTTTVALERPGFGSLFPAAIRISAPSATAEYSNVWFRLCHESPRDDLKRRFRTPRPITSLFPGCSMGRPISDSRREPAGRCLRSAFLPADPWNRASGSSAFGSVRAPEATLARERRVSTRERWYWRGRLRRYNHGASQPGHSVWSCCKTVPRELLQDGGAPCDMAERHATIQFEAACFRVSALVLSLFVIGEVGEWLKPTVC